jgi:RimJ/RimL family protein N-acetyltransferase
LTRIETDRLILRNWRLGDCEPFLRLNTDAVMRWLGGVRTPDAIRDAVTDRFMRWQDERGFTFWVVERRADAELLGFCGIKIADDRGSPVEGDYEIGWRLREDAWGQGYAKEAAIAALDVAFAWPDAARIVALTVQGNKPSWALMERLGMTRRPDLDYEGPEWAAGRVIVYVIGREEWRARTS